MEISWRYNPQRLPSCMRRGFCTSHRRSGFRIIFRIIFALYSHYIARTPWTGKGTGAPHPGRQHQSNPTRRRGARCAVKNAPLPLMDNKYYGCYPEQSSERKVEESSLAAGSLHCWQPRSARLGSERETTHNRLWYYHNASGPHMVLP